MKNVVGEWKVSLLNGESYFTLEIIFHNPEQFKICKGLINGYSKWPKFKTDSLSSKMTTRFTRGINKGYFNEKFKEGDCGTFSISELNYLYVFGNFTKKTYRRKNKEQMNFLKSIDENLLEYGLKVINFSNGISFPVGIWEEND